MNRTTSRVLLALLIACITSQIAHGDEPGARLKRSAPEEVGMRSAHLARIDALVQEGLDRDQMPGCVVAMVPTTKYEFSGISSTTVTALALAEPVFETSMV